MSDEMNKQKHLSTLTDSELDVLLMARIQEKWQKVARIISGVMSTYNAQDEERLLLRINSLVKEGKIEVAGNIQTPRFSEVRLPVKSDAGEFGKGITAYGSGDFELALKILEPLGLNGEGGASWRVGEMYANGLGVKRDNNIADKWYRQALSQGYLPAQESLDKIKNQEE